MLRFVINLDTSVERMDLISRRLLELDVSFERISAVNGRLLSSEQIQAITYPSNHYHSRVRFTRELTRGEVGCFLSHRECWKRLVESNQEWALVMEDDIQISSKARGYMQSSDWIPSGVDICQLSCLQANVEGRVSEKKYRLSSGDELVAPVYPPPLGTQCYLISRKAAEKAIYLSEKLPAPVDNFLFSHWFDMAHIFTVWRVSPTLVIPNEEIVSDIGQRNKRVVRKAPFWIRHGFTRLSMDYKIQKYQRTGVNFTFKFEK